jgi:hypothetical protein
MKSLLMIPCLLLTSLSFARSHDADSLSPKNLFSITATELFIANFQLNYERFLKKKKNSIELGVALKLGTMGMPVSTNLGFSDPYPLEYLGSSGFTINANYKINLSKRTQRFYLSLGPYFRYFGYHDKYIQLTLDDGKGHDKFYWQSASHNIVGANAVMGRQFFFSSGKLLDLYAGFGGRINHGHDTIYKERVYGMMIVYDPPKILDYTFIEPAFQIGVKFGFYK